MPDRPADTEAAPRPEPETRPERSPQAEPPAGSEPETPSDSPKPPDRRTFLRQLSSDAVWTAGRVAGASAAFRRSLVAAGETAISAFETAAEPATVEPEPDGADTSPGPVRAVATTSGSGQATSSASVARPPVPPPDPVATLTADQHTFLGGGTRAALAVNDPTGHPLLAYSEYHWDGSLFRLPARDFTARTIDIDRDPRVALLIDDPASGAWVAVNGVASLVYGERMEPEMLLILSKYHDEEGMANRWEELRSTGEQVVIQVQPRRFVWRGT